MQPSPVSHEPEPAIAAVADVVIVGAGSAGCVLANRLSEDADTSVLLLEAGGENRHWSVQMPSAFYLPMGNPKFNWGFRASAAEALDGRSLDCPRGRGLGGSSAINGMVYVRGHPRDFERWAADGATGWGYANALPYFKKAEHSVSIDSPYRGQHGPLTTCEGPRRNPLYHAFLNACAQAGHPISADLNGHQQEGFGALPMTVAGGVRASTARAYLDDARTRTNLRVETGCTVTGVDLDSTSDRPLYAGGVTAVVGRGQRVRFQARQTVILAAGAIGSPHLLQLSGVGDGTALRAVGLPVRHHLPGVGRNLMDHLEVYVQYAARRPVSIYPWTKFPGNLWVGARWLTTRTGLGATNHFEVGGFIRSTPDVDWPDIQYHFLPAAMRYDGRQKAGQHGFQVHVGPMLPTARGHVRATSPDVNQPPEIDFRYLSTDADVAVFRAAVRSARAIISQPALAPFRDVELAPGPDCETDAEIDGFVRAHAESAYHPCGTCRMGSPANAQDALRPSVVDPAGRVHGIDGLRVVDASIFPYITNGNLNAPTIMAAEKIADAMRGAQLPPLDLSWHGQPETR